MGKKVLHSTGVLFESGEAEVDAVEFFAKEVDFGLGVVGVAPADDNCRR